MTRIEEFSLYCAADPVVDRPVPAWVDPELPPRGPCGICGGPDARHRVLDAMFDRYHAGEIAQHVADDYGVTVEFVERVAYQWDPDDEVTYE